MSMPKTELRSEVEIEASPERVYRVLTDFERFPEWNPFVTSASGKLVVGQKLSLELSLPEGRSYEVQPELMSVEPNRRLAWRVRYFAPTLLELRHFFELSERSGRTRLVQGLDFSGFLLRFAGPSLTLAARGAIYMNRALKKRAEDARARIE
jgi:hypothetical protein